MCHQLFAKFQTVLKNVYVCRKLINMKDQFTKQWITENAIEVCSRYEYGVLTIRGLHYQLVSMGMTNTIQHYKRVVNAMISARWDGIIAFEQFSDLDRTMVGATKADVTVLEDMIEEGKESIKFWMNYYRKNQWENQPIYPEVLIEKKALQGVFEPECRKYGVTVGACKGYPSLTFMNDMAKRFMIREQEGKEPVILYFGDYDPSGEDIPRSMVENLRKLGVEVYLQRIALMEHQVIDMNLPPAPAKSTDSRTANWDGLGQVELDAVKPELLRTMVCDSIEAVFDRDLYRNLKEQEATEAVEYRSELKTFMSDYDVDAEEDEEY